MDFPEKYNKHQINSKVRTLAAWKITSVILTPTVTIKCTIDRQFKAVAIHLALAILCRTPN